jgi:PAS domain S-box-containing protein
MSDSVLAGPSHEGLAAALLDEVPEPQDGWQALFRTVLHNARNPMAVVDEDRRIVDVNPAAEALTGFARPQLIGRLADDFFAEHERAGFAREWRELVPAGDGNAEREMLCADGGRVVIRYKAASRRAGGRGLVLYLATQVRPVAPHGDPERDSAMRYAFSPREREVVQLVAQGLTTRDIADELRVSLETVRTHIRHAMAKLGSRTRAQLVARALAEGLI